MNGRNAGSMISLKIPSMAILCVLLLKKSLFEQEETEECGREGLMRFGFRYFDLLWLMICKGWDHGWFENPSSDHSLLPPVKKSLFEQEGPEG